MRNNMKYIISSIFFLVVFTLFINTSSFNASKTNDLVLNDTSFLFNSNRVSYSDNSGISANTVQSAIEEIYQSIEDGCMVGYTKGTSTFTSYTCNKKSAPSSTTTDFDSSNVKYDNSNNGLTSTTVKAALGDIASYVSKCEQYKHVENETTTSYDCVADVYTATFYYQSNPNNGSSTVSSLTTSCNASTVGTCRADIPTEVRNSVGTYNTPYYGLSASTGSMQYAASKIYTDVTISGDKPFYAIYQGQVTIYYPFGFDTCDSTSYYKNQFLSSTSTMAAPVITGASSGTTNRGFSSYIQYYDFDGFAATDGTNTITYNDVASLADSSAIAGYAVNSKSLTRTFYYSTSVTGTKGNSVLNGTQYLVCNGASVDVIEEGLTPPNSIAPYGTSFLGWGVGPNTMTPSTINPNPTSGNYNFYAIYQSEVTNYYYNNGWASRTLYHNAVYKSETNYSVYLSTSNTGMSNYSTSGGPDSSLWNGLSNDANGTAEYSTVAEAALGSDNTLYSLYKYYVYYFAGSHVSSIGANSDNCNAYARDPNNGTPSCYVTLPTITPGTGYYAVGWNTTSGATTGTPAGSQYEITVNRQRLYANAIDIWAENLSYDNSESLGINCTDFQCALDSLVVVLEEETETDVLYEKIAMLGERSNINYVLKYDATTNGAAIDTPDGSGDSDVYYYTNPNSLALGKNNSNVIFGDYCWRIVRTTTNGGVKLIYNGPKTSDDKCPENNSSRPSSIGVIGRQSFSNSVTQFTSNKYYGESFEIIDDNGTWKFRLKNVGEYAWSDATYQNIVGKYLCGTSSSATGTDTTCEVLYHIGYYDTISTGSYLTLTSYTIGTNANFSYIGTSLFNTIDEQLSAAGYKFGNLHNTFSYTDYYVMENIIDRKAVTTSTSYYYGDEAVWVTNHYELRINGATPTSKTTWANIRDHVAGMYTCRNTTDTSCSTVYYVVANSTNTVMFSIPLSNNETYDKEVTWKYGTGYEENNGVYSLTGVSTLTFALKDWYTDYSNSQYKNIYVCDDFTSTTCSNTIRYIYRTSNYQITFNTSTNNYIFGNSVNYTNGNYTILDTNTNDDKTRYQHIWNWYNEYNSINNSHYTCFKTDTNDCGSSVYYVYYTSNASASYIELKNYSSIENFLQYVFNNSNSNINTYNSSVKGIVESWYESNLLSLSSFINNDAVFCNDRTISNYGAFSPTGSLTSGLMFSNYNTPSTSSASLSCPNLTDRFSKNNTNLANLKYPIGLLSSPERALMGAGNYAGASWDDYWLMSPRSHTSSSNIAVSSSSGVITSGVGIVHKVKPAIVLQPGVTISEGIGTYDSPYIIDTSGA